MFFWGHFLTRRTWTRVPAGSAFVVLKYNLLGGGARMVKLEGVTLFSILFFLPVFSLFSQTEERHICDPVGEDRLASGNIDEAEGLFKLRLADAIARKDTSLQVACLRSLGFSKKRRAASVQDDASRRSNLNSASKRYEEILKIDPENLEALQELINIYVEIGSRERVQSLRKKLLELQGSGSGRGGGGGGLHRLGSCDAGTGYCCYGFPESPCGGGGFQSVSNDAIGEHLADAACGQTPSSTQFVRGRLVALNSYRLASDEQRSGCLDAKLDPPPHWVASGAWDEAGNLIVADTAQNKILVYDLKPGSLGQSISELDSECCRNFNFLSRVLTTDQGLVIHDRGLSLSLINSSRKPVWHLDLAAGTKSSGTEISALRNWTLAGDYLLGFGDVVLESGVGKSAIFYVPLFAPSHSKLLLSMDRADPARDYYSSGFPYFASSGGKMYFISMEEVPAVYELGNTSGVLSPRLVYRLPEAFTRAGLPRSSDLLSFLEAIGKATMPAGLFFASNRLFLLTRRLALDSSTIWELSLLDLQKGVSSKTWRLPVRSAYLTVVPGERYWALLAKGNPTASKDGLRQEVTSVTLFPSEMLNFDLPLCGASPVLTTNGRDKHGRDKQSQPAGEITTLQRQVIPFAVHE
jgi:hypothetical protein